MKHLLLLACLPIFLFACQKEKEALILKPAQEKVPPVVADEQKTDSLTILLAQFVKLKNETENKVRGLSPADANALYDAYFKESSLIVHHININQEHALISYYEYLFDKDDATDEPEKPILEKAKLLQKAGLEFWDIGEAMVEIRPAADFYKNIFYKYVNIDYKQYITFNALDDKELWVADAGVIITWEALGKRVFNWESFIKIYPQSNLLPIAHKIYKDYASVYITGLDNTRAKDWDSNILFPEIKEEFNHYINIHPQSSLAPIIKLALDNKDINEKYIEVMQKEIDAL